MVERCRSAAEPSCLKNSNDRREWSIAYKAKEADIAEWAETLKNDTKIFGAHE